MNTFTNFVTGYLALWVILFLVLAYLIVQIKKLKTQVKNLEDKSNPS